MRVPGIIGYTGQSPLAYWSFSMLVGGAVASWASSRIGVIFPWDLSMGLGGAILSAAGLALGCWGIRCPICKTKWVLWAMRTQPFQSWLHIVLFTDTCPKCHAKFHESDVSA
jgi:hypothetical protein